MNIMGCMALLRRFHADFKRDYLCSHDISHGPIVSVIEEIEGREVHTHDYCQHCGKVFQRFLGVER
jgi:hypothetical protein